MGRRTALHVLVVAFALLTPCAVRAQTTTEFHLHEEGEFCCRWLKQATGPDLTSPVVVQSGDLKNHGTEHGTLRAWWTAPGAPNWYGAIASGSTIRFKLWMKKTASWGVFYPEAQLRLNDGAGALFCQATGVAAATPPTDTPLATSAPSWL